jgi:UDP-3-O-[3-hydroxymyristoyl] glucosamine N-acyltransferase
MREVVMNFTELQAAHLAFNLDRQPFTNPEDYVPRWISSNAEFRGKTYLGPDVQIDDQTSIGSGVAIGDKNRIGSRTRLAKLVVLEDSVFLDHDVTIFQAAHIGKLATISDGVIIGPNVTIPPQTQLGSDSIIPTSHSLVTLSSFGTSNRTVTIHGSDDGPRFSIGCQYSIDWERTEGRISEHTETTTESAEHYQAYLPVFKAIGEQVQRFYDMEGEAIQRLRKWVEAVRS